MVIEAKIQRIKKMACMVGEKRHVNDRRKQLLEMRRQEILRQKEVKNKQT